MPSCTNLSSLGAILVGLVLVACGGSDKKYLIPADAPELRPFVAPDAEEFDDEDDWGEGDDDDDDADPAAPADGAAGGGAAKAKAGSVKLADASVKGSLDKEVIRKLIRGKRAQVVHCYERELVVNPKLEGTVKVVFTINPDGSVIDVAASGLAVVDSCVGKAIASIVFPKPKGGDVVVRYPFVFTTAK